MNVSINAKHTKSIHIKLTIAEASIYLRLCYEKYMYMYVEPSRQQPTSNIVERTDFWLGQVTGVRGEMTTG